MPPRTPLPLRSIRTFATTSSPPPTSHFHVFNRNTKRLQRDRAASNPTLSRTVDYLRDELATRLTDRLHVLSRPIPHLLDLGAGPLSITKSLLTSPSNSPLLSRISHITSTDLSPLLLSRDLPLILPLAEKHNITLTTTPLDEDAPSAFSPFPDSHFSAVLTSGSMHWINNLPLTLSHINRILLPDAPLIAAMIGGDTLFELRTSIQLAELERRGGISPRVSPMADTRDVGALLDKAGFKLITVDVDDIVVDYPDIFALMADLGAMGEGNAVVAREDGAISREVLVAAQAIYKELHGNEDGSLPATFRIIYMIGWKKGEGQPEPLERGSGQVSMKDALSRGFGGKKE